MLLGASMVKWTKKVVWYTKTIIVLVKGLKIVEKGCLNWILFDDDLYCCVIYSNVEYQNLSLNAMLKKMLNLVWM